MLRGSSFVTRSALLAIGALAVALVVGMAAPASSAPARLSHNGLLAFDVELHSAEIYLMGADGNGVTRLTNDPGPSRWPVLSQDGSKVAFASERDGGYAVYAMNIDGTGLTDVSMDAHLPWGFDGYPDWSPDGTKLAFTANTQPNGPLHVVVYDLQTKAVKDLTPDASYDLRPQWSPDGTRLAYAGTGQGGNLDVYVVNADGS